MGLFTKRKRRSTRKAEQKALKHKAALEAKQSGKLDRKRLKSDKKVAKAQVSALKAQENASNKLAEKAAKDRLSPGQVKKYLGVARVLAPVLTPVAYKGATFLRGQIDTRKAQRFGVDIDQLGKFTGHGAKLTARIANAESSTTELVGKRSSDAETEKFVGATRARLTDLHAAAGAAEQMPAARRKTAHQAIAKELDGIEADLLARLGVH